MRLTKSPAPNFWVVLTSTRQADALAADVRAAVHDVDQTLPVGKVRTLTAIMSDTVRKPQFTAVVMSAFAAAALLIAAIGLYGVLAFDVTQQRREMGVRVALGATPASIRWLVLARGVRLVGFGLVTGTALAVGAGRAIAGLLFHVPATDMVAFFVAGGALAVTALAATWLPARRAARADPIEALRAQ